MKDVVGETQVFTGLDIYNLIEKDSTDVEESNHPYGVKYLKLKDVLQILYLLNLRMQKDYEDCDLGEYTKSWIESNLHELIEGLQKADEKY